MTLSYTDFQPKCSVKVFTQTGEIYDLTGDLTSWQTSKTLDEPQGAFMIQLVAAKHAGGKDWTSFINPMDYVEIRASETGKKSSNGLLPIIMRGFVDTVGKTFSLGQTGGPAEPRITIQGRDFTKLLLEWQILYLFTQNNQATMAGAMRGYGLLMNYNLPIMTGSIKEMFQTVYDTLVSPIPEGLKKYNQNIPGFSAQIDLPDYDMSTLTVASFSGSYWNLFDYIASPPYGELFVYDGEYSPIFVCRMPPYRTYNGTTPSPATELKPTITINTAELQSYNISKSDNDVYNYFLTWGDMSGQNQQTQATFTIDPGNGVNLDGQELFGPRPLIMDTPWISQYDNADTSRPNSNAYTDAAELNTWLFQVMGENQKFTSGTMTLQGRANYTIGQYATVPTWGEEYYISGVSHQFTAFDRWDVQLSVTRGRPLVVVDQAQQANNQASRSAIQQAISAGVAPPNGMLRAMQPNQ